MDRREVLSAMPKLIEDMQRFDFGRFQSLANEYLVQSDPVLKLTKEKERLDIKIKQMILRNL